MDRDILNELNEGSLTEQMANAILDDLLETPPSSDPSATVDLEKLLGFSRAEWTAFGHGALLSEVAEWRRSGWPRQCAVCGGDIIPENFGWLVMDVEGHSRLKHIVCPQT